MWDTQMLIPSSNFLHIYLRVTDRTPDHLFKGLNPLQLELSIIVYKIHDLIVCELVVRYL